MKSTLVFMLGMSIKEEPSIKQKLKKLYLFGYVGRISRARVEQGGQGVHFLGQPLIRKNPYMKT